jgi:hypothetical protein
MVQRVSTVAFEGIEARSVDVQVQVAPGLPAFSIVRCQWQNPAPAVPDAEQVIYTMAKTARPSKNEPLS